LISRRSDGERSGHGAAEAVEVSNELWAVIRPLWPERKQRFRHPGRKRLGDRLALQGILFVLHTGIA
jgi:transposase